MSRNTVLSGIRHALSENGVFEFSGLETPTISGRTLILQCDSPARCSSSSHAKATSSSLLFAIWRCNVRNIYHTAQNDSSPILLFRSFVVANAREGGSTTPEFFFVLFETQLVDLLYIQSNKIKKQQQQQTNKTKDGAHTARWDVCFSGLAKMLDSLRLRPCMLQGWGTCSRWTLRLLSVSWHASHQQSLKLKRQREYKTVQ